MLQIKAYICCKTLSNCIRNIKSAVKNHRLKAIRLLRVKCAPVAGIAKKNCNAILQQIFVSQALRPSLISLISGNILNKTVTTKKKVPHGCFK